MNHPLHLVMVTTCFALAASGQESTTIHPPSQRPPLTTWKIASAKVGIQKDGGSWTTTLWLIAPRPIPQSGLRTPMRATLAFIGRDLKPLPISVQLPGAQARVAASIVVSLPANADRGIVLTGADAALPATLFTAEVAAPAGYLVFALPQHRDKAGLLSQVFDETASTSGTVLASEFGVAFDIAAGRDMQVIMYNPRAAEVPILVQAYDVASNEPYTSIPLSLPAQAPGFTGSFSVRMLSDILGSSPEFADRRASGRVEGILRFSGSDTFAVSVGQMDVVKENGYAILSLAMQGVKIASPQSGMSR